MAVNRLVVKVTIVCAFLFISTLSSAVDEKHHQSAAHASMQGREMLHSAMETAEDEECESKSACLEGTQLLQLQATHVKGGNPDATGAQLLELNDTHEAFASFMKEHGREYAQGSDTYAWRHKVFTKRASGIQRHNSQNDRLWTASINKLTDRSDEELRALLGWSGKAAAGAAAEADGEGAAPAFLQVSEISSMHSWGHAQALPAHWSWGHLNATKHVHNQGQCGSCWAVSSVIMLQAHVEIHTPWRARPLSVQELVSCVANPNHCGGKGACDGATAELAMDYVMRNGLASTQEGVEAVDPKNAHAGCPMPAPVGGNILLEGGAERLRDQLDLSTAGIHQQGSSSASLTESRSLGMQAWERLPVNSYQPLMHALVQRGPAAVAVFASKWFSYAQGIFDGCEKDAVIDHAVALIGYGHDRKLGEKYWTIQNSWGPEWGEGGRIRLLRKDTDDTDYCGIDAQPQDGTGCDGGPKEVKVCGMCGILYDVVVPHF